MKFILGKKLESTQVWRKDDEVVSVTKVQAGPCVVTQVKTDDKDGYKALQVGFGIKKEKNIRKPQKGHLKKLGNFRYLKEFRTDDEKIKTGDKIDVSAFEVGDKISVTGISKGKGFQGVVRKYGFKGQKKTHGNKDQLRMPGSIGATGPAHVFKGTRMPGRMGNEQVTVKNLEIVEIDTENSIISIKGAIPGAKNGLIMISSEGELKIVKSEEKPEKKSKKPEATKEKKVEDKKEKDDKEVKQESKK